MTHINPELTAIRNHLSTSVFKTRQYFEFEYAKEIKVLQLVIKFNKLPETTNQKEILQRRVLMIEMLRELDAFNNPRFPEMSEMGVDELILAYIEIFEKGLERCEKLIAGYDYLLDEIYI